MCIVTAVPDTVAAGVGSLALIAEFELAPRAYSLVSG